MNTLKKEQQKSFTIIIIVLSIISFIGIAGYGLSYILKMPAISPGTFIPQAIDNDPGSGFGFGNILAVFILIYAFAFLPIVVFFTSVKYEANPFAMIIACCLIVVSLIIEIINNLPLIGLALVHVNTSRVSPEILLYMKQHETVRYLSFDVAGFTLLYIGFFFYSLIFYRTNRWLTYVIIGSILLFILNVPFLWIEPKAAIILMVLSILAFATIPFFLVRMIIDHLQVRQ